MADEMPRYRFRGSVKPCAEVKRPVAVHRNAATDGTKATAATIDIFDVIDSWGGYWGVSAAEVNKALSDIGKVDTLYVRINSPGGEGTEGIAIANLLRAHAAKIHTTNYGLAASAASFIATAGDVVAMAPGSMLMIHEAWNIIRGTAADMRAEADALDKLNESIAGLYALKGGTDTDWRALMHAETWFTPEDAVAVGLADKVGIETSPLPAAVEAADPLPTGDETAFDMAARMFDLSVFEHAPAARAAHTPPAVLPEKHPTNEEAVTMTETELKALREQFGLGDDADEATVQAELVKRALEPKPDDTTPPEITDEQAAAKLGLTAEQITAAKNGPVDGMVTVPKEFIDSLKSGAEAGHAALARQDREDRDKAITKAQAEGKLSKANEEVKKWQATWERLGADEATKWLNELPVRFPVNGLQGLPGSDQTDGDGTAMSEDEAEALAALSGTTKEGLLA